MSKNKILVISYFFPPHKGAGVQRPLRLVDQLVAHDWDVSVVSSYSYSSADLSLHDKISHSVNVYRYHDPIEKLLFSQTKFSVFLRKVFSFLLFPDRNIFWAFCNKKKVIDLLRKGEFQILYVTVGPFASAFLGFYLKLKFPNIKFILDYRDAWSKNPSLNTKKFKPLFFYLTPLFEKFINSFTDLITTVSLPLAQDLICSDRKKIHVLYNGYDPLDFKDFKKLTNGCYNIFYSGSLYFERNPDLFLEPFEVFLKKISKSDQELITLTFIGESESEYLLKLKNSLTPAIKLSISSYVSHKELLRYAEYASLCLLLIDKVKGSKGVVTGKIFEYLNFSAPILAIVPSDGAASEIIKKSKTGFVFNPGEHHEIINFLLNDFNDWKSDPFRTSFNSKKDLNYIKSFSSAEIFKKFKKFCLD